MSKVKPALEKIADHLLRKTSRDSNGCLLWTGPTNPGGYGKMDFENGVKRKRLIAHRAAYELAHGQIPSGKFVCHKCDVKICCEPSHLFLGDARINYDDMVMKGRGRRSGESELQQRVRKMCLEGVKPSVIRKQLGVPQSDIYRRAAELWFDHVASQKGG